MTIERRIYVTTGIITVSILIIGSILFWNAHEVEKGIDQIRTSAQVFRSAFLLRTLMDEYLNYGDERPLRQWHKRNEFLGRIIHEVKGFESIDQALLKDLEIKYQAVNALQPQIIQLGSSGNQRPDLKALKETLVGTMSVQLEELVNAAEDLHTASQSLTLKRQKLAQAVIFATSILMIGLIVLNLYQIRKTIVSPLQKLSRGAEMIGAGNFDYVVESKSKDEVGKLAQAFNTMVERLKTIHDSLQAEMEERRRAQEDLRRINENLLTEIAERKRSQLEIERWGQVFEHAQWGVLVTSEDLQSLGSMNPAFAEMHGYTVEELTGRRILDVFAPEERARAQEQIPITDRQGHYVWESKHIRKDGTIFPVLVDATAVKDEEGKVLYRVVNVQDITERKRAEEELIRSNQDLQHFAYVASHDLQEPLRNVASCLQMLEKDYKNKLDANADQYIHYAVDSAVRMKALILDLLAYSRVATKGTPPIRVDCEQTLDRTLNNLGAAISETGAVITHDPLPTISADDTQLLQVFQNLIGNAIKFRRDDPPRIHVSAAKNRNEWIFSVKDNGIGIESQHLERIFVIFQRLHKRSQYEGTGMGLAIVKKVVERHGGRVWVESEPGVGTSFYFTMPQRGATHD
jgi:PAS domain S-box-containing protein